MREGQRYSSAAWDTLEPQAKPAAVSHFFIYFPTYSISYAYPRCLEHVINLATVAVMGSITKIAAIENAQAIWEFDPTLDGNRVLGGSLDVIAAIRTIAIKVSGIIES